MTHDQRIAIESSAVVLAVLGWVAALGVFLVYVVGLTTAQSLFFLVPTGIISLCAAVTGYVRGAVRAYSNAAPTVDLKTKTIWGLTFEAACLTLAVLAVAVFVNRQAVLLAVLALTVVTALAFHILLRLRGLMRSADRGSRNE